MYFYETFMKFFLSFLHSFFFIFIAFFFQSNVIPSDSNPDLESYEVLATNSNGSEASSDYSLSSESGGSCKSPEVENISSVTNAGKKLCENQSDIENSELSENNGDNLFCTKFEEDYENDFNINQTDCDQTTPAESGVCVEDIGTEDNCIDDSVILRKRSVPTSSKN